MGGAVKIKRPKTVFFCQGCGYKSAKWHGKCPACGEWNLCVEEEVDTGSEPGRFEMHFDELPQPIESITSNDKDRLKTGISEMDRVLGGGIVKGSSVLVGGDPGIGKSTLLLQLLQQLAVGGLKVLYVSGEESARQIKLRGIRVGATSENLYIYVEISLEKILAQIAELAPHVVVIDSIQTIYSRDLTSAPGSVGQVRESSERLILMSKKSGIPIFLIGHVTKDGAIAGPKVLEHMVDAVLYFQGDAGHVFRIIRGVKNRYGPTNEIGVFEMWEHGLREVSNPSQLFLSERPKGAAGSVVVPSMEGTRPILVEVQSLVGESSFGMPRRTTIGVDHNRVSLLAAVLDKVCGLTLANHDIFINVAGGVRLNEPAVDLAIVSSIMSSFLGRPIDEGSVVCGEVGLTGEIRGVGHVESRIKEAARMGFTRCLLPHSSSHETLPAANVEVIHVGNLKALMDHLF